MLYRDQNTAVIVSAPAKLNLFLKVLGQRNDGYHELETLMVSVGLYDTLRISPSDNGQLELHCVDGARARPGQALREPLPTDERNLVVRAARLLQQETGTSAGARIELIKRIPLSAGLAGGSSDAAATLAGLNRAWRLGLARHELQELAARLGSDVPFFLSSSAVAICRGRGEIIEPQPMPLQLHFVIARPREGLSTAEVFRHCRPSSIDWSAAELAAACRSGRLDRAVRLFHNALQEPAERLSGEVTRLKGWFARQPFVGHMMSGSGTSYFGLARSRRQALQLSARLQATRLGDVFVARSRP